MPWEVDRSAQCPAGKPWAVLKAGGELVACHATKKSAQAQMRALYASEEKAMSDEPELVEEKTLDYVPWGVTTFAALEAARQADNVAQQVQNLAADFEALTRNILSDANVTDKPAALKALADEFGVLVSEPEPEPEMKAIPPTLLARVAAAVKGWLAADAKPTPTFTLWKEASGGYRWLATYSNRYRDRDNPPEILSEAAHQDFVKAVDGGDWPAPELWLWHTPRTQFGQADWVAYADGFALASGLVGKEHAAIAERLERYPAPLAVSHGMPVREIERDADDRTVITRYRTREISVLPAWAAANALTGFQVQEVGEMAIPQEKKEFLLAAGLSEERVASIEAELEGKAKEAADAGLEFKESEPEPAPEPEPVEQPPDDQKDEAPASEPVGVPAFAGMTAPPAQAPVAALSAQDIALAVRDVLKPLEERLTALESLKEQITALNKSQDERVAAQLAETPAASLADLLRGAMGHERAVGSKETRIDGRSSLAKSGPEETEAPPDVPMLTNVSWINNLIAPPQRQQ